MRNVRTCRPDVKEEAQKRRTRESESTDAGHGGGLTRSSDEVLVMRMERRG
jgi:RNA-directed DNA polymerase